MRGKLHRLQIEGSWTEATLTMVPKVAAPTELSMYRPLVSSCAVRKWLGYMLLELIGHPMYVTCQTGFVHGQSASTGHFILKRMTE
eukprot:4015046-Prorocentrum_lima.AAC.1